LPERLDLGERVAEACELWLGEAVELMQGQCTAQVGDTPLGSNLGFLISSSSSSHSALRHAGRSIGRGIRNFKAAVSGEDDEDEDAKVVEQRKSQKSP